MFANFAQDPKCDALARKDVAPPLTVAAGFAQRLDEIFTCSLARHLDQAQFRDLQDVRPGFVSAKRLLEHAIDLFAVSRGFHVDEIDDDQTAQIAEAQLVHDLLDRFEVGLEYGLLQIAFPDKAARVDVDRSECLALVDYE